MKIAIGLTGPNAAGKGEAASYLGQRGFALHSLSDIVREEALKRGLTARREHLIRIGNELRGAEGPGILAERIIPRLEEKNVIDSIRNPDEVRVLRALPRFMLLGVWAPVEIRFARAVERDREGDPATLEEFEARERQENSTDPNAQQLDETFRMADSVLTNDGDIDTFHRALERVIAEY